ncbi:MAG TPA: roadblock/LC7 domain-containing protein [Fibrobacteraceae bacterium]|nr:roadblock/LC7 domain-containing protein [Fibrobacteraceae bacterium]
MSDFAIYTADAAKIQALLEAYKQGAKAEYVLLCHRDGSVIAEIGQAIRDASTLAVLGTASFDSARQIGLMIGEEGFRSVSYTGAQHSVYISAVGESLLLVQVFPGGKLPKSIEDYSFLLVQKLLDAVPAFTRTNTSRIKS